MSRYLPILIVAVLLPGAVTAQPSGLSFAVPPENRHVEAETINVVLKRGETDIDELRLEVNGRMQSTVRKRLDRHHLCLEGLRLDQGRNLIKVYGLKGGRIVEETSRQVYYMSPLSGKASAGSSGTVPYVFHNSPTVKTCAPCHDLAPGQKEAKGRTPEQSKCYICHRKILSSYRFVHGPAAVWDCRACHDLNGGNPGFAAMRGEKLCAGCHEISWSARKFGHGPTAAGNCTTCHNPHAADDPFLLRLPPGQVCTACHEDVLYKPHVLSGFSNAGHPVARSVDPNNPKGVFTCVSCHDPHAENTLQFLKGYDPSQSMRQYCRRCHRM